MDNYFKEYAKLKSGLKSQQVLNSFRDNLSESETRKIQQKIGSSFHAFDPDCPTFGYFVAIKQELYYIGFDYNIKVGVAPLALTRFFEEISRDKSMENTPKIPIQDSEFSADKPQKLEDKKSDK